LFLFAHPDSKFFELSPIERKILIYDDFLLKDETFSWEEYEPLLIEIAEKALTKAERALMRWEKTLHERDDFIASVPYDASTYEMKDKLLANTSKLWDQYETILDRLTKEKQAKTLGDIEESLAEKGDI